LELQHSGHEAQANPLVKRFRIGQDKTPVSVKTDPTFEQPDEECNSHVQNATQVITYMIYFSILLYTWMIYLVGLLLTAG